MQERLDQALRRCRPMFEALEEREMHLTRRVQQVYAKHRVSAQHMAGTTGYGYDDIGRDTFERVLAEAFGCEDALVRPQIVSGTHALAVCLFGLLKPGEQLLSAVGKPYDTLDEVIGIAGESRASLRSQGVGYQQVELLPDGTPDLEGIGKAAQAKPRVVLVQRSRGYAWRPSLTLEQIRRIVSVVRAVSPDSVLMVDNCYGEFVGEKEPSAAGADVLVGSLIKNAGGGMASTGGYIAGKALFIEQIADRLTSPGIGREVGSYAPGYREFYQGFFLAPHVVGQALRTSIYAASLFDLLGFEVHPVFDDADRSDIIQAIRLDSQPRLLAFCQGIQEAAPVDAFALPEPWDMPGYTHPVIMAAGTFVGGASIEMSADAPVKDPYIVYLQGGLSFAHGRLGVERAAAIMREKRLI